MKIWKQVDYIMPCHNYLSEIFLCLHVCVCNVCAHLFIVPTLYQNLQRITCGQAPCWAGTDLSV